MLDWKCYRQAVEGCYRHAVEMLEKREPPALLRP
jgi:hypothetical protein